MPLSPPLFQRRLVALQSPEGHALLRQIRIGLEREALRVDADGALSRRPHPKDLGAPLTHPYITTDYSEAMIELVTPPGSLAESWDCLGNLHRHVTERLEAEQLWCGSMPCVIAGDPDIPLARYGDSNAGRMKTIYRRGLGYRYTRSMQVISGVHFNCSMPDGFWLQDPDGPVDESGISERYFGVLRNLFRHGWLIAYLFGASPAVCRTFVAQKHESLELFTPGTYYGPHATSLRLSSIGYQNSQEVETGVQVDYNSRAGYIDCLREACPEYQAIGVRRADGEYLQLNANRLQIENEYYSPVRPKCVPHGNEKPTRGLRMRGVEYVELRSLDIDPFEPCGIGPETLRFLTALVVCSLLDDSPMLSADEQAATNANMQQAALYGRDPDVALQRGHGAEREAIPLRTWAEGLLADIRIVCELLDEATGGQMYRQACRAQEAKVQDAGQTPSARMVASMRASGEAYVEWILHQSAAHRAHFDARALAQETREHLTQAAEQSWREQQAIEHEEREHPVSFEDYLATYEAQE